MGSNLPVLDIAFEDPSHWRRLYCWERWQERNEFSNFDNCLFSCLFNSSFGLDLRKEINAPNKGKLGAVSRLVVSAKVVREDAISAPSFLLFLLMTHSILIRGVFFFLGALSEQLISLLCLWGKRSIGCSCLHNQACFETGGWWNTKQKKNNRNRYD